METIPVVNALAAGRVTIGTAALLAPRLVGRGWIGEPANDAAVTMFVRTTGVRDVAVGAATLRAAKYQQGMRTTLLLGVACDAVDFAVTLAAARRIGWRRALPVMAMAGSAVVTGLLLARPPQS
jgi:hypothetical protein